MNFKNLLKTSLFLALLATSAMSFGQTLRTIVVAPNGTLTYSPATTNCFVGDTVRFFYGPTSGGVHPTVSTNNSNITQHTLDANNNEFRVVMTSPGTTNYECVPHAGLGMTGVINVTVPFVLSSYIPFSGTGALNTNGWSSHSGTAGQTLQITSPSDNGSSLSYVGLPTTVGNRTQIVAGNSEDMNRQVPTIGNTGSAYYSALIKFPNASGQATNTSVGNYFMHLSDTNGTTGVTTGFVGRLSVRAGSVANTIQLGILNNGGAGSTAAGIFGATPVDYPINTTLLVVVKYNYSTNTASLWVNPTVSTTEPTALVVNSQGASTAPTKSKSICIRQAGNTTAGTGNIEIDEIRVTNNWNDVLGIIPAPAVRFNPTTLTVNENAGTASVTLSIANANANATTAEVLVKGGSATLGSDYTFTTQTVTFPANSTADQTFTFPIIDDAVQENAETIELVIRNTTNSATIAADSIFTATIPTNDVVNPVVQFLAPTTDTTAEGASQIFRVAITNANTSPTSVTVFVKSTSTTDAGDYSGIGTNGITLTFPASSTASIADTITITDDSFAENAENLVLVLRNANNGAVLGSDSIFTVMIPQNDQPMIAHFVGSAATVSERAGTREIMVMAMAGNTSGNTSFDVVVKGGTATANTDYTVNAGTYTIPGGRDSMIAIIVNLVNDTEVESNEDLVFAIRNITNSGTIAADSIYTLTITSDDIALSPISALRANDANGVPLLNNTTVYAKGIVYGVDMQGSANNIQYTLIDNTGGVGLFRSNVNNPPAITIVPEEGDSLAVWGRLNEFNGLTQINLDSVKLISKANPLKAARVITALDESTESDLIRFNNAVVVDTTSNTFSGTTITIASGTDTLTLRVDADVTAFGQGLPARFDVIGLGGQFDNTNPKNSGYQLLPRSINDIIAIEPSIAFIDSATYSVLEGAGSLSIRVKLDKPTLEAASVNIQQVGGSASGADYSITNSTISFAIGDSVQTVTVNIIDDSAIESLETIILAIGNPVGVIIGQLGSTTVSIVDNDVVGTGFVRNNDISLYPNPAQNYVKVNASSTIQKVQIINGLGQLVVEVTGSNNEVNINTEKLSSGMYQVLVRTENGFSSKKLQVK